MKTIWAVVCWVLVSTTSCVSSREEKRIINGVYRDPTKAEMVAVRGDEIEFRIRIADEQGQRFLHRKYEKYALLSDGKFWPTPTTSSDAALGVGRFDWRWDGKNIVRRDPKDGTTVIFALQSEGEK